MSPIYLHHIFLHFPIGLLVVAGILAVVNLFVSSERITNWVLVLLSFGFVIGLFAMVAGLLSADHLVEEGVARETVNSHRNAALLSLVFAAISLVLLWIWRKTPRRGVLKIIGLVFVILSAVTITITGDRGGRMIHPGLSLSGGEHEHEHGAEGDAHSHEAESHEHGITDDHHDEHAGSDTTEALDAHEDVHEHDEDSHEAHEH